jgi:pimeloyl-ACP methyl ester carboxylesterase
MRSSAMPWKTVPLVGDYGRPAGDDLAGPRLGPVRARPGGGRFPAALPGLHRRHHQGGDVFVLAHGLGGRWQHWSQNIPALGQRGRVIAVDLPGFGGSRPLPGRYWIDRFADAIAELCRQLRLPPAVFLGHSLGGPLAVRFATRHADLAKAIVLVAGTVDIFAETLGGRHLGRNLRRHPRTVASTYFEVPTAALPAPRILRRQISRRATLRRSLLWAGRRVNPQSRRARARRPDMGPIPDENDRRATILPSLRSFKPLTSVA